MTPRVVPTTQAGRRLFTDVDPMDMWESNGVTPEDIAAVEAEARRATCTHPCRECADPLDVSLRPDLSPDSDPERDMDGPDPFTFGGERPTQAEVWRAIAASQRAELTLMRGGDPAAVPGWWAGLPILIAVLVLGIVIGWYTA